MDAGEIPAHLKVTDCSVATRREIFKIKNPQLKKLFNVVGKALTGAAFVVGGVISGALIGVCLAADTGGGAPVLVPVCAAAGGLALACYVIKNRHELGLT